AKEAHMIAIGHFLGLVVTTLFAAAAAVLLDWVLLRAMFQLMRPAAAKPAPAPRSNFGSELVQGTRELARVFGTAALRRSCRKPLREGGGAASRLGGGRKDWFHERAEADFGHSGNCAIRKRWRASDLRRGDCSAVAPAAAAVGGSDGGSTERRRARAAPFRPRAVEESVTASGVRRRAAGDLPKHLRPGRGNGRAGGGAQQG